MEKLDQLIVKIYKKRRDRQIRFRLIIQLNLDKS